jgi:O-antigen/teichoic acid export membrane protein
MTMEMSSRYMLRWLTDLETVGLYAAGYKLGMLMVILVMGFNMGWQPFYLRRGKQPDAEPVFARIATYFMALLGFVLLTGTAWVDIVVRMPLGGATTLLGPAYWASTNIVPLVLLGYCGFGAYVLLLPGVHLLAKSKWVMVYRGAGAVSTIALNLVLIPRYGALGAAIAMVISFFLMAMLAFSINQRFYFIPFEWSRLSRIAILVTIGLVLHYQLPQSAIISIGLTLLMPVGLLLTGMLNSQERAWLGRRVRRQ